MHQTTLKQTFWVSIFSGSEKSRMGQRAEVRRVTCKAKGTVRESSYLPLSGCVAPIVLIKLLWKIQLCSAHVRVGGHKLMLYWEMHTCTIPAGNATPVCWANMSSGTTAFARVTQVQN